MAAGYDIVITVLQGFSMDIGLAEGQPRVELLRDYRRDCRGEALSVLADACALLRELGSRAVSSVPARARRCSRPPSGHPPNTLCAAHSSAGDAGHQGASDACAAHELRLAPEQVFEDLRFDAPRHRRHCSRAA